MPKTIANLFFLMFLCTIIILLSGCETIKLSKQEESDFQEMIVKGKTESEYFVYVKGISLDDAEKKAKDMMLIHTVSTMIGEEYERRYRNDIQQKIYSKPNIYFGKFEILDRYQASSWFAVKTFAVTKNNEVKKTLVAMQLDPDKIKLLSNNTNSTNTTNIVNNDSNNSPSNNTVSNSIKVIDQTQQELFNSKTGNKYLDISASANTVINNLEHNEIEILAEYLNRLVFLVFSQDKNKTQVVSNESVIEAMKTGISLISPDLANFFNLFQTSKVIETDDYTNYAVSKINTYLSTQNYTYIEKDQIYILAEDQNFIREETGNTTKLQRIADKLGSEIYIVTELRTTVKAGIGVYNAQTYITLNIFESATGKGLGIADALSAEMTSYSSEDVAIRNSIDYAVNKALDKVINLSINNLIITFKDGIRYQIILQDFGTTANRIAFENLMKKTSGFRRLERPTSTQTEAKYFLYYMGLIDDFEQELFALALESKLFENLNEIIKRHNSLVLTLYKK